MAVLQTFLREETSPDAAPIYASILRTGGWMAVVLHLAWALTFGLLGDPFLVGFNLLLAVAGGVSLAAVIRKHLAWGEVFQVVSLLTVGVVPTFWLGWGSGFFLFAAVLVPLSFLAFERSLGLKIAVGAGVLAVLQGLFWYLWVFGPWRAPAPEVLAVIQAVNLTLFLVLLAFQSINFAQGVSEFAVRLKHLNLQLGQIAFYDPLTQLPNRRALWERLEAETARARRHHRTFSVALADIDGFKGFNDQWGHDVGDEVLIHTSRFLAQSLRQDDLVGRWGGEEFLILLPESGNEEARAVLERFRQALPDQALTKDGRTFSIRMTIGHAAWKKGEAVEETLRRADEALLLGKRTGKDRVVQG